MPASRRTIRGTTPSACPQCQQTTCAGRPHSQPELSPFPWIMSSSPVASAPANQKKFWEKTENGRCPHLPASTTPRPHHQQHQRSTMLLSVEATPSNGSNYITVDCACKGKIACEGSPRVTYHKLHHRQRHSPRIARLPSPITEAIPKNWISGNNDDGEFSAATTDGKHKISQVRSAAHHGQQR